jgi:hypothetical protein
MRVLFLLLAFVVLMELSVLSAAQPDVILQGVAGEYGSLDEIKPVLVNGGNRSIHLLPEDCGEAQLLLFYMNRDWREGVGPTCSRDTPSIEVKSSEHYQIPPLVWRPLITRDGKVIERKSFPGRYRIVMRYTLEPTQPEGKPRLRYRNQIRAVSQEFIIRPR